MVRPDICIIIIEATLYISLILLRFGYNGVYITKWEGLLMKTVLFAISLILTMFLLVSCTPGVSQSDYNELKNNLELAETELIRLKDELNSVKTELEVMRTYAEVYDVSVDPLRISIDMPTKYGWLGPEQSPDYINTHISKVEATGDNRLIELVEQAYASPWGEEKDIAWNEFRVYLADCLVGN
jgi:hypothetical protein